MNRIKILVALIVLCLALGVKAQDKAKFDLPQSTKAMLADSTTLKANIAGLDSLIKGLQQERTKQKKILRFIRSIGLSLDKLPTGVERTLVGWPCVEYPALVQNGYADIERLSPLLQLRQDILNDPEGFDCDIWDEPFNLVLSY